MTVERKAMSNESSKTYAGFFRENGYVLLSDFLPASDCAALVEAIEQYRKTKEIIKVDRESLIETKHFLTLNGSDVETYVPDAERLYRRVNQVVNSIASKEYVRLGNKAIGLSINIVPSGGVFSWHYDRNEITAVLYLNEVAGGDMELYPRYRLLMKRRSKGLGKWLQRVPDAIMRPSLVRRLSMRSKVAVSPKPGTLLIMEAIRCLHRVRPVVAGQRYSVQFAYDAENVSFDESSTKDYYGYK